MTNTLDKVLADLELLKAVGQTAHVWWRTKRPAMYSLEQHLNHPTINCDTPRERELAQAVAQWLKTKN